MAEENVQKEQYGQAVQCLINLNDSLQGSIELHEYGIHVAYCLVEYTLKLSNPDIKQLKICQSVLSTRLSLDDDNIIETHYEYEATRILAYVTRRLIDAIGSGFSLEQSQVKQVELVQTLNDTGPTLERCCTRVRTYCFLNSVSADELLELEEHSAWVLHANLVRNDVHMLLCGNDSSDSVDMVMDSSSRDGDSSMPLSLNLINENELRMPFTAAAASSHANRDSLARVSMDSNSGINSSSMSMGMDSSSSSSRMSMDSSLRQSASASTSASAGGRGKANGPVGVSVGDSTWQPTLSPFPATAVHNNQPWMVRRSVLILVTSL